MLDPLVIDAADTGAPFAPGQHVYECRRPENGSLRVNECEHRHGHWRGHASLPSSHGLSAIIVSAPSEDFALCPDGWREPPPCPAENPGFDAASEVRRAELREDAVYQARIRTLGRVIAALAARCFPGRRMMMNPAITREAAHLARRGAPPEWPFRDHRSMAEVIADETAGGGPDCCCALMRRYRAALDRVARESGEAHVLLVVYRALTDA